MSTSERIWDQQAEDISYVKEMVTHPGSVYGLLGAILAGAVLSFPLGLGVAAVPVLFFAAIEAIAALFIPSSPVFQEAIQRKKRRERREKIRAHLIDEIKRREPEGDFHWKNYHRMLERTQSLRELAGSGRTTLTDRDVERLEDTAVDYLSLWLAWLVMAERWRGMDEKGLNDRLQAIDKQMDQAGSAVDRKRLEKAKTDLERILTRRQSLWGRATGVEAGMLAMADTLEEVYQRVITNPGSGDAAAELQSAVERMRVEEELDLAVDSELDKILTGGKTRAKAAAPAEAEGEDEDPDDGASRKKKAAAQARQKSI